MREDVLRHAVDYLISNYNRTVGLVRESPDEEFKNNYYVYSDNYLVSLVLSTYDASNDTLTGMARDIRSKMQEYVGGGSQENQYRALGDGVPSFCSSANFNLTKIGDASVRTTANNQSGLLDPADYADIAFLQAVYHCRQGNDSEAMNAYLLGVLRYDGTGFVDNATEGSYATYKLALYIYASELLNLEYDLQALYTLLAVQRINGGFATSYTSSHTYDFYNPNGTNTETTCLAILALVMVDTDSDTVSVGIMMIVAALTALLVSVSVCWLLRKRRSCEKGPDKLSPGSKSGPD
ncbi:MAG: hypothetical protein QXU73_00665 [Thermoplasmata archaeon]